MGISNILKINFCFAIGVFLLSHLSTFSIAQDKQSTQPKNLADAFGENQPNSLTVEVTDEVEPIVVGREKWDSPNPNFKGLKAKPGDKSKDGVRNTKIVELDPLETKQGQNTPSIMPIKPPGIPPAVNIHRNFEGKLVLKPRKFGFQRDFPFQLENSRGKRLAFIDTQGIRAIDPLSLKDKKVNILGKLEPLKEGSDELVIRARILREIE